MNSKREEWVDALRATAMLFVIAGHLMPKTENSWLYFLITSPVKIPLFFAITGYVFKDRNGNVLCFLRNLIEKIAVPWLILSFIYSLGSIPFKGISNFFEDIVNIIVGKKF